ncbi:MAG: hypothetical protein WCX13_03105 [Candidatus Hydrogenedentales bacterium]
MRYAALMRDWAGFPRSRPRGTGHARRIVILLTLCSALAAGGRCEAQEDSQDPSSPSISSEQTAQSSTPSATPIPKTYSAEKSVRTESAAKAKLRRIAITGMGTFPLALFYTNFIFDSARFASNGFDVRYAPWPFKSQYSAEVSSSETFIRLGVSLGLSAAVGILDAFIQRK